MASKEKIVILDSFAVLAYLEGKAGTERVKEILREAARDQIQAFLSLINLGEVAYIVERERGLTKAQETLAIIEQLPIDILPINRKTVMAAAHIKGNYPLAYADAFVIAISLEHDGAIVTGDPEFKAVSPIVRIDWLSGD